MERLNIAAVLLEHYGLTSVPKDEVPDDGDWKAYDMCECGHRLPDCYGPEEHAAHQADVVMDHIGLREEWGLDWGEGECYPEPDKEAALVWLADENASEKLLRRRVTAWEEA